MDQAHSPRTILCIASYFKGTDFLVASKQLGWRVLLITSLELKEESWPWESIDEVFYMPEPKDEWKTETLIAGINGLVLRERIHKVVALDDFDVEKGAAIREHLRVPGMGLTRAHYFRDKLAMRMMARESGIAVPDFMGPFHPEDIQHFLDTVPAPWILKPRSSASTAGIKKLHNNEEAWQAINNLGEKRVGYVLERFIPGHVYHVDALTFHGKVVFARASQYMSPPFEVYHQGGLFRSHTLPLTSKDSKALLAENEKVMKGFGMLSSASHTEFLKSDADGKFYFIETSSRVGGANLSNMVEAATGINLWKEWAKIETTLPGEEYKVPKSHNQHAGIIISLARQERPDLSDYQDPEICWRMDYKDHHAGLIVCSDKQNRIIDLLNDYAERFSRDFYASMPAREAPSA